MKKILTIATLIILSFLCFSILGVAVVKATSDLSVTVSPDDPSYMNPSGHVLFIATASGGTPSYDYRWGVGNSSWAALYDVQNHPYSEYSTYTFGPHAAGTYYVLCEVRDAFSNVAYSWPGSEVFVS